MDFCGPLKTTERGNKYILNIVCWFTRYISSVPLHEARANTIAHALLKECVLKYGTMTELVSDQASSFTSHFYQEFCNLLHIKPLRLPIIRWEAVLRSELSALFKLFSKFTNIKQEDWDLFIPCVAFCYNTSINEATGKSPYFLMFGRDPVFTIDRIQLPDARPQIPGPLETDDYKAQLVSALRLANYTSKSGLARKLCFSWIGQFRVLKVDHLYVTIVSITSPQSQPRRVHLNQIKKVVDLMGPASTVPSVSEGTSTSTRYPKSISLVASTNRRNQL
ncbi:unnamed protein product [Heligmosomoides polygyrus]|uniref:Integrase catalytic domain-containing protein n=1 Tax=Heligmosomoides polygyrus TaxID=6339 RepID=A0A3P7U131_HELPZ|nr:unnamed protein product [Heligmosomoides polygyrus]